MSRDTGRRIVTALCSVVRSCRSARSMSAPGRPTGARRARPLRGARRPGWFAGAELHPRLLREIPALPAGCSRAGRSPAGDAVSRNFWRSRPRPAAGSAARPDRVARSSSTATANQKACDPSRRSRTVLRRGRGWASRPSSRASADGGSFGYAPPDDRRLAPPWASCRCFRRWRGTRDAPSSCGRHSCRHRFTTAPATRPCMSRGSWRLARAGTGKAGVSYRCRCFHLARGFLRQPDLADRPPKASGRFRRRVRAKELWRVAPELLDTLRVTRRCWPFATRSARASTSSRLLIRRESYSTRFANRARRRRHRQSRHPAHRSLRPPQSGPRCRRPRCVAGPMPSMCATCIPASILDRMITDGARPLRCRSRRRTILRRRG